jgi:hypothetical protein
MIRFVDATGLLGNAVALSALASRVPGFSRLGIGTRHSVLAAVMVGAFVPLGGGLPLAAYLRGAIGDLSVTSLLLLLLYLARLVRGVALPAPVLAGREALLALVAATAVVFYPLALGWGSFDPYRLGYGSYGLLAALLVLALAAAFRRASLLALAIALAVLAWSARWYASTNLWDYLLDPLLSVYAIIALAGHALRRRRRRPPAGLQ